MAVERLSFSPDTQYHGFEASAHLARYAVARDLCRDARVLDIACGEGYGTALLADWGARAVLGVDISAQAVDAATKNFPRPNTRYLCADAVAPDDPLSEEFQFDLIVCFETFEHVADPDLLLRRLAKWCSPGGTIVISCPNDPAASRLGISNEFHLRSWTVEEFRDRCEFVLGVANAWLLQTPVIGATILLDQNCRIEPGVGFLSIMQARSVASAQALPPQGNIVPDWSDCLAYIGVWGKPPREQLVATPVSYTAYSLPWRNLGNEISPVALKARYNELLRVHRTLLEQREQDRQQLLRYTEAGTRYNELLRVHRTLLEQREQDRQQLLKYASGLVVPKSHRASSASRIMRLTGSPRVLKFYLRVLRVPVLGRVLGALRRVVLLSVNIIR